MPVVLPESGTITLEPFERYVTPTVPSAPPEDVQQAIRDAAKEFCRRTNIWTEQLPDLVTVANTETYDLDRPDDSDVYKLIRASVASIPWRLKTYAEGLAARQDQSLQQGESAFVDPKSRLHLAPAPILDGLTISVDAVLVPTSTCTTLPGLLEQYAEDVSFGALMRLLRAKGTDWFDLALSEFNAVKFDQRISKLALRKARGFSSARLGKGNPRPSRFY
jgi:hypothetical protein